MILLQTLGTAQITAGRDLVTPNAVRGFALLLRLAAEPDCRLSRASLRESIFPNQSEAAAGHSLRELVYQFRKKGLAISANTHGIALGATAVRRDYIDVIEASSLTAKQTHAVERGFLQGYFPDLSSAFSDWLAGFKERTSAALRQALMRELSRTRAGGDRAATEQAARACLSLDPLNEEATLTLAEMLALSGSKVRAIELLDAYITQAGARSSHLRLPASMLKRRILE